MDQPFRNKKIGEILLDSGALTLSQHQFVMDKLATDVARYGEICLREGLLTDDALSRALAEQFGLEYIELQGFKLDEALLNSIPPDSMFRYHFVPLEEHGDSLVAGSGWKRARSGGFGFGLTRDNVDTSLEIGPVLNHHTRHLQIADQLRVFAKDNPVGRLHVSVDDAVHVHLPGANRSPHLSVGADYQTIPAQVQPAFHPPVDLDILLAADFTLNRDGPSDGRAPLRGGRH